MNNTRPDIPLGYTRNENGHILSYKGQNGSWYINTFDDRNRPLVFREYDGYCEEFFYDLGVVVVLFKVITVHKI